jgi:predicted Zn-dependent protease
VTARVVVAVVAAVVIAWLAVMERDARLQAAAGHEVHHGASAAELASAGSHLRAAGFLNPDRTVDISRAVVLWTSGHRARARAQLEDVVRAEPDDLVAWNLLRLYAEGDRATISRALAARRRLDPLGSRRR